MNNTIDRQAALEGFESVTWHDPRDADIAHEVIGRLSSAEPEVIHCNDCNYSDENGVCQNSKGLAIQDDDDFCSHAERREK